MAKKRSDLVRLPLTDDELWTLTADQFFQLKLTEEEKARLREINKQKDSERAERLARIKVEQEPILAELRDVGLDVRSVWDLANSSTPYPKAIPILLKHLSLPYSDVVKEGIARSLAVPDPEVREAWSLLVEEYRRTPMGCGIAAPGDTRKSRLTAKDGLACALAASVTDERLVELVALAKDRTLGGSRVLLLSALKRRRNTNPLAAEVIDELAEDPELKREIASWSKR